MSTTCSAPNYYNEMDLYVAQWLRNLIDAGHIAPGVVDTRSILDVSPDDLKEFKQCHFFAGLGGWSYALRLAGWPDDRPIWTASCPCQPFSMAGMGGGFDDERHLWPYFQFLVAQRRPAKIVGEQVASKAADAWLDLVQNDLEGLGYAFGAIAFPSAGVGAPHIRDRTYWVADSDPASAARLGTNSGARAPTSGLANSHGTGLGARREGSQAAGHGQAVGADSGAGRVDHHHQGLEGFGCGHQAEGRRVGAVRPVAATGESGRLADAFVGTDQSRISQSSKRPVAQVDGSGFAESAAAGPTNGFWRDADWLGCRDGKWRPVEPGAFPLAHGAAARVGRLRAYGNAINAEAARCFIEVVMECVP